MTPAELAYKLRVDEAARRLAKAVDNETEVRVIACALMTWMVAHVELGNAFADLSNNVMLPLLLNQARGAVEGDRALHDALRRIG